MELSVTAQAWVNLVLVWVGFGTVVGLVANMFLPAGSPPGLFGNLVVGITGSCVGPVMFVSLLKPPHFHPMSPMGFIIAILASVLLLLLYRGLLFLGRVPEKKN